jgi:predicted secreted protein
MRLHHGLFTLSLITLAPLAGTYSQFEWLGFSPDGKFVAYETYGVEDGSGSPFSSIQVVDVEKNSFKGAPVETTLESGEAKLEDARAKNLAKAQSDLQKSGIKRDQPGTPVAILLETHNNVDRHKVSFFRDYWNVARQWEYQLDLKNFRLPSPSCKDMVAPEALNAFELTITSKNRGVATLQKDSKIPSGRGCTQSGYGIYEARIIGDHLAVLVGYDTPGFEGPNKRWLVVTGNLPK